MLNRDVFAVIAQYAGLSMRQVAELGDQVVGQPGSAGGMHRGEFDSSWRLMLRRRIQPDGATDVAEAARVWLETRDFFAARLAQRPGIDSVRDLLAALAPGVTMATSMDVAEDGAVVYVTPRGRVMLRRRGEAAAVLAPGPFYPEVSILGSGRIAVLNFAQSRQAVLLDLEKGVNMGTEDDVRLVPAGGDWAERVPYIDDRAWNFVNLPRQFDQTWEQLSTGRAALFCDDAVADAARVVALHKPGRLSVYAADDGRLLREIPGRLLAVELVALQGDTLYAVTDDYALVAVDVGGDGAPARLLSAADMDAYEAVHVVSGDTFVLYGPELAVIRGGRRTHRVAAGVVLKVASAGRRVFALVHDEPGEGRAMMLEFDV